MAMVCRALENGAEIDHLICVTGQHRDLLDAVLSLFGLIPSYDLDVMKPGQECDACNMRGAQRHAASDRGGVARSRPSPW